MTENEAIALIEDLNLPDTEPQQWADLGCGSGLFTYALAALLGKGSSILAIDKKDQAPIKSKYHDVRITFKQSNFIDEEIPGSGYNGILMANSFHYVKDKTMFIQKVTKELAPGGKLVLIEYDTRRSNPWVPYPVPFNQLRNLFVDATVTKIGEHPSKFGYKKMYAAVVNFNLVEQAGKSL